MEKRPHRHGFELIEGGLSQIPTSDQKSSMVYEKFFNNNEGEISELMHNFTRGKTSLYETIRSFDIDPIIEREIVARLFSARYKRVEGDSKSSDFKSGNEGFNSLNAQLAGGDVFKIHTNLKPYIAEAFSTRKKTEINYILNIFETGRYLGNLIHESFKEKTEDVLTYPDGRRIITAYPIGQESYYKKLFSDIGLNKLLDKSITKQVAIVYYRRIQPERLASAVGYATLLDNGFKAESVLKFNELMRQSVIDEMQDEQITQDLLEESGAVYPFSIQEQNVIINYIQNDDYLDYLSDTDNTDFDNNKVKNLLK